MSNALCSSKFRATEIWNEVIAGFRDKVPYYYDKYSTLPSNFKNLDGASFTKKRQVFTGAAAVSTLVEFLSENQQLFGFKSVTTETIVKLCEIYMRDGVIVPATTNVKHFENSDRILYGFSDQILNCNSSFRDSRSDSTLKSDGSSYASPDTAYELGSDASVTADAEWSEISFIEDLSDLDDQLVHDLALFRLLTLVEIPVLDGILNLRLRSSQSGFITLDNLFTNFKISGRKSLSLLASSNTPLRVEYAGPVSRAGVMCLQQAGVTDSTSMNCLQTTDMWTKKILEQYKKLTAKHGALFSAEYYDILEQIHGVLARGRDDIALEALQLLMLLMSGESRRRIGCLLYFLNVACCDDEQSKYHYFNLFQEVVFSLKLSCNSARIQLLNFMTNNYALVLKCPHKFRKQLINCQIRQQTDPEYGLAYCKRITKTEFEQQKSCGTERELTKLVSSVLDDTRMTLQYKIVWLERFRREYPEFYTQHFSDLKW